MDSSIMRETLYITNSNAKHHLRFMEWEAYRYLVFGKDRRLIQEAFGSIGTSWTRWSDTYQTYRKRNQKNPAAKALHDIHLKLVNGEIKTLDVFYDRLRNDVTHRKLGKALVAAKERQAKKAATKEAYAAKGEAFIDNNRLVSMTMKAAVASVHTGMGEPLITELLEGLVSQCSKVPLSANEMKTLRSIFAKKRTAMEQSISEGEAAILRNDNKKLAKDAFHLYGLCKLNCEVGDTWELSQAKLLKGLGAGKATALPAVKLLHKLGLIETYEKGKRGTVNAKATIYRRLR
ncbi:hypothetical protein OAQ46_06635 [Gammaproteobacteria bacterium]|nr:hypothetical protein [Gammaproteobacteria bacterium]